MMDYFCRMHWCDRVAVVLAFLVAAVLAIGFVYLGSVTLLALALIVAVIGSAILSESGR